MSKYRSSLGKFTWREENIVLKRGLGVVPGCSLDPKKGRHRFDKWYALPETAHRLYWRVRGIKTYEDMAHGKHIAVSLTQA